MSQAAEEVQLTKGLFARARALRRCAVQLAAQEWLERWTPEIYDPSYFPDAGVSRR